MKRLLVIAAMMMFASPALAGRNDSTWNPPARFDHAYTGKLTVKYLPQKRVVKICKKLLAEKGVEVVADFDPRGCAVFNDARTYCTVFVVNKKYRGATPKAVLRHEVGHCNGWDADHHD